MNPSDTNINRRRLIQTAAISGAVGLAGAGATNVLSPVLLPEEPRFDRNISFWSQALPSASPALTHDIDADVLIVGGGFLGLSAAYYLRQTLPGSRVVLLEAVRCGNGASGRNGAMVLTQTDDSYLKDSDHPALDRRLYELTSENTKTMIALSRALRIDCELEQNGALQVVTNPSDVAARQAYVGKARDQGFPFEFWSGERTVATIGARGYAGAVFDPGGGQVHPGKLVAMWKAAALRSGAELYDSTPVVRIEEGAINRLTTATGLTARAPHLILATNAFTSKLGYLRNAVAPIFDNVCITPVLGEARMAAAGWRERIPFNDDRTEVFYAGRTRDNRIHFGGGPVDYQFNNGLREPADIKARYAGVHREFSRRFPSLAEVPFEACWNGVVDMSLDTSPSVGQIGHRRNIYYGIGFSGHGVNLTSVFGHIIADLVAGRRDAWTWLPYLDGLPPYVPNEPFRWLGVEAALGALKLGG